MIQLAEAPPQQAPVRRRRQVSPLRANINLTRELAVTSFKLKYTGSALGYLWSLAKPLMIFGMMYLVFALFLLRGRTSTGENFAVELLLGVILWTFFADATTLSVAAVAGNGHMIRKAYFPRWILVLATTISASMTFAVNIVLIFIVGLPLHWFSVGVRTLAVPLLFLELYALVLGCGLLVSALFVFYRDVGHIWEIVLQLLFYGSAIVYPLTLLASYHHALAEKLVALLPTAQIVEDMRHALVSPEAPWTVLIVHGLFVVPLLLTLAVLGVGWLVFERLTPRFAESL